MTANDLTEQFTGFQGELKSFLLRMTASVQDAEDIVQETYLKAHAKLDSFRGESTLKTWVFTIASNLARDLLRAKKRWPENVTDICKEAVMNDREFFYFIPKYSKYNVNPLTQCWIPSTRMEGSSQVLNKPPL